MRVNEEIYEETYCIPYVATHERSSVHERLRGGLHGVSAQYLGTSRLYI